jgi:hypothetical protein
VPGNGALPTPIFDQQAGDALKVAGIACNQDGSVFLDDGRDAEVVTANAKFHVPQVFETH